MSQCVACSPAWLILYYVTVTCKWPIGIWKCSFLWREENRKTRRKPPEARTRTNNKLNPRFHVTLSPHLQVSSATGNSTFKLHHSLFSTYYNLSIHLLKYFRLTVAVSCISEHSLQSIWKLMALEIINILLFLQNTRPP